MGRHIRAAWVAGVLGALLWGTLASAQQSPMVLRLADTFPADHFIVRFGTMPFMKKVEEVTKGAIKFQYYPSGQLGKSQDLLLLTQNGLADIAFLPPSYASDKMPLSAVAELPGMFKTGCEGSVAFWKLWKNGFLAKAEFLPNRIIPLFAWVLPPYQILTRDRQIASAGDFRGLKLRTAGGAMDLMARRIGAVPIRMVAPDVYESLNRGTLDGIVFPLSSVVSYHLDKSVKYMTEGQNFGSFVALYAMNERKLRSLPEPLQKALVDAGEELIPKLCADIDKYEQDIAEQLLRDGVVRANLSPADDEKLAAGFKDIARDWASGLDARGKPGTATLQAFEAALADRP